MSRPDYDVYMSLDGPPREAVPGALDFAGRRSELSALHTRLSPVGDTGAMCVLTGPSGIGKTALAAAYARTFTAGHPAGVWWVSLAGSGADPGEMAATFAAALRARMGNPPVADVVGTFAERIAGAPEPGLLVVDDIPGEITTDLIDRLTVPSAGIRLRRLLITNRAVPDASVTTLDVGPMAAGDATGLLRGHRDGPDAEVTALAERVGGHALALRLAGLTLRDGAGELDYAALADRIDRDAATTAPVSTLLHDRLDALGEPACRLLRMAVLSTPAAIPAGLIRLLLGSPAAEQAAEELHRELLAVSFAGTCQVHALVRAVARQHLPPVDWTALARQFADAVLDHPWSNPVESFLVARHAARLAGRPDLPDAVVDRLHRRVIAHHEGTGETFLALPHHQALAQRHFDDPAVLVETAQRMYACGEPEQARESAERAMPLATDPAMRHRARLILAESLEELGDTSGADPLWTLLTAKDSALLPYYRSRRLRGHYDTARRGLTELIDRLGTGSAVFDEVQAAQLELARTEIEAGAQPAARRRAVRVIAAYADRRGNGHAHAVEAIHLLADARLTLTLTDLKGDRPICEETACELRRLRDLHAGSHGPRHRLTLGLAVAHAESLAALGRPGDARRALEAVRDDVFDRFPPEHPTMFRGELVLGFAAAQSGRNENAREHFAHAFHGFRAVLGDTHPNTLRAELALGVALKLTSTRGAARHMLHVLRHAPASVGIGTDLFFQSAFGSGLSVFPSWLWRRLTPQRER